MHAILSFSATAVRFTSLLMAGLVVSAGVMAQTPSGSAVGSWQTIDDETGKAKSVVQITDNDGVLSGKVVKILTAGKEDAVCDKCEGDLNGAPIIGLTILTGMVLGDDGYKDGEILDPGNGKTYSSVMWLEEEGAKLKVRGYVGIPLFGRSQTWNRIK